MSKNNIKNATTAALVNELINREGVKVTTVEPYIDYAVNVNGPAVVLVIID